MCYLKNWVEIFNGIFLFLEVHLVVKIHGSGQIGWLQQKMTLEMVFRVNDVMIVDIPLMEVKMYVFVVNQEV